MTTNIDQLPSGELETIPYVGPSISRCLRDLGIDRVEDLVGANPVEMFEALCEQRETRIDRCVLYVFRSAIYYASRRDHDPELLKWWRWKGRRTGFAAGAPRS